MSGRIAAWAAASLLLAWVLSACGGSSGNGVASKSPNEIVTAALSAVDSAKSAHIAGHIVNGTTPTTLDLNLVSGKGGRGQVSEGGVSFRLEVLNHEVYVNAGPAFWTRLAGPSLAPVLQGKWLKAPEKGRFKVLAQLTNLHGLLTTVLSTHGTLVKSGTTTINGQSAVGVRVPQGNATIYVATTGQPYPLEIVQAGKQGGRITLDRINESVTLTPPAKAIDVTKLK